MMATFIAKQIMKAGKTNEAKGQAKYRAYFINTSMYEDWKDDVDTILTTEGYDNLIVTE